MDSSSARGAGDGLQFGNFEAAAAKVQRDIKQAVESGGESDAGGPISPLSIGHILREVLQNAGLGPGGQGNQGGNNQGGGQGGQQEQQPVAFNPNAWADSQPSCTVPDNTPQQESLAQSISPSAAAGDGKIDICDLSFANLQDRVILPQVPQGKRDFTVLAVLGTPDNGKTFAVPAPDSNLQEIFVGSGYKKENIITYKGEHYMSNIAFMPAADLEKFRSQSNVIEFNVDPGDAARAAFGINIKQEEGQTLEFKEGHQRVMEEVAKKWQEFQNQNTP